MNWKRKFRDIILERGKYYYTHNCVQGLTYKDLVYSARVIGDYAYQVEIKIQQDDVVYMKCSCAYAVKGNYCKHMAAVMFAIEDGASQQLQLNFQR